MRNKVLEIAINEIGYKEGKNNENKYSKELYNKAQEWCADFIRWVFIKAGIENLFPESSYVPTIATWYDKKNWYYNSKAHKGKYTPKPGDLILFDYNLNGTSDHIGIVEKVEGITVHTIEGNKDDKVVRAKYAINAKVIRAYAAITYPTKPKPTPTPTPEVDIDQVVQDVIKGKYDVYPKRYELLRAAGYNPEEVQKKVNEVIAANNKRAELKVGDKVRIVSEGNANSFGTGRGAGGIGWIRDIIGVSVGTAYPYKVGTGNTATGWYKATSLRKV